MTDKVEIITDASGNKKSVVLPYALYEQLITALAAHNESLDKVMEAASTIVQAQEYRVESKAPARVADTKSSSEVEAKAPAKLAESKSSIDLSELDASQKPKDPKQEILRYQRARAQKVAARQAGAIHR